MTARAIWSLVILCTLMWSGLAWTQVLPPHPPGGPRGVDLAAARREVLSGPDPGLPPGQVVAQILDSQGLALSGTTVALVIKRDTVAEGTTEDTRHATTDAAGRATFSGLPTGGGCSFRLSVEKPPARYASEPFGMDKDRGHRVTLRVLPATSVVDEAMLVGRIVLYLEPLDETFQVTVLLEVLNAGNTTWVPQNASFRLPDGWSAFSPESAQGTLEVIEASEGVRLAGSVGPGRHGVVFSFRAPRGDADSASIGVGLPLRVASARVMMESSQRMRLMVAGFPEPTPSLNRERERILAAQLESGSNDALPLDRIDIRVEGLTTRGKGRWLALVTSLGVAAWGLGVALRSRKSRSRDGIDASEATRARGLLFDELVSVEKAFRAGRIGPETHEQARDVLVEALARLDTGEHARATDPATPDRTGSRPQ